MVARRLDEGGVLENPYIVRMQHRNLADFQKEQEQIGKNLLMPGADNISAAAICTKDVSELIECCIMDLLATSKGAPATGFYI